MTKIYIPRVIESVSEANRLPGGTLYAASAYFGSMEALPAPDSRPAFDEDDLPLRVIVPTAVDAVESVQLGQRHHLDLIDRHPFTVYIDYQETP